MEPLEGRRLLSSPTLDLTFGNGGSTNLSPAGIYGEFFVVHQLSNGKIVAVGRSSHGGNDPVAVRLNADGTPDATFADQGVFYLSVSSFETGDAVDAVLAPDGKILLLHNNHSDLLVTRFNADGTLDSGFGSGGTATIPTPNNNSAEPGATIDLQSDGKIILSYDISPPFQAAQYFLSRLNADGSIDQTFRGSFDGSQPLDFNRIYSAAVGPDDKIVLAGVGQDGENVLGMVERFNAEGSVDQSFGTNGIAQVTTSPIQVYPRSVTVDSSNRVIVNAEDARTSPISGDIVERFTSGGVPDPAFGQQGVTEIDINVADSEVIAGPIALGSDGSITAVANDTGQVRLSLLRLNSDGTPDSTFGSNGVLVPPTRVSQVITSMELESDESILVAGGSMQIAKFATSSPDVALDADGNLFVTGTAAADTISLEHSGNQLIVHRDGVDTPFNFTDVKTFNVYASDGGDTISVPFAMTCNIGEGSGNDSITLGDGDDTVSSGHGNDTIVCGVGDHQIDAGDGNNSSTTGAGQDTINSGSGNDSIVTGPGDDAVFPGDGANTVTCSSGDDTISTGAGSDTVHAGAGDDIIDCFSADSTTGSKTFFGEDGNDIITGAMGKDTLMGGAGRDIIIGRGGSDYISGGGGDDKLAGGGGHDRIRGGNGQDQIDGGTGNDRLFGDAGDDRLYGGGGNNVIDGGEGTDAAREDMVDQLINIETQI